MKVFFNDDKKIVGVYDDDNDFNATGLYRIDCPVAIKTKLDKSIVVSRQKHTPSGKPLFVNHKGAESELSGTILEQHTPATEEFAVSRLVGLREAPAEWSVSDVLNEKYSAILANQKNYKFFWFDEFLSTDVIDANASLINSGVFGISVPPESQAQTIETGFPKKVGSVGVYVEADDVLKVEICTDGATFVEIKDFEFGIINKFSVSPKSDKLKMRLSNLADDGAAIPVHAIALFY